MCICNTEFCPKCDPGIEGFYQTKVEEAKLASAYLKTTGCIVNYEDLLDAKDIWHEYCELKRKSAADDAEIPDGTDLTNW